MTTIFKRDFCGYFQTPIGYAFIGVFLTLSGILFYLYNIQNLSGDLLTFLSQLTSLTMLLCPLLTMPLLCEPRQKRTDRLLMTVPVSLTNIVLGKYLAAACVMLLTILLTNGYTLIILLFGKLYIGEWFVGYLGFTLQSLSFIAADLFVTCFAKSQITGAISAFAVNFVLWMADLLAARIPFEWLGTAMKAVSLYDHYTAFLVGQLSPSDCLFYVSFIFCALLLSVRVLDQRRFSEGGSIS